MKVPLHYYRQDDVLALSRDMLGKWLMTSHGGVTTGGIIVETEAYRGPEDKASHAFGYRRTPRNETMYAAGGVAYVYLCYGIHCLFNIITNVADVPHGILVRAIEPREGIQKMLQRRQRARADRALTGGPGALTQALGITRSHNGESLRGNTIWIEDKGEKFTDEQIITSPRVGVDYAGTDALLPWRFRVKDSLWTSSAR